MSPKYIAFFVFLYVIGTILGLIMEDGSLGVGQQSILNKLTYWRQFESGETWGIYEIVASVPGYVGAIWKAAIWDFSFLDGNWVYVKWVIWAPLMAMFIWGIILTFISIFQKTLT